MPKSTPYDLPSEEADAKEVIALIEREGRKAVAVPGDIGSETFCKKLVSQAHRMLGGLDILALVAGKQHAVEKIADITTKQLEETYEVNVFALFWTCKAALPIMPSGGSIITTASTRRRIRILPCSTTHPSRRRSCRSLVHLRDRLPKTAFASIASLRVPCGRPCRSAAANPTKRYLHFDRRRQ